jgi:hypothetical protein
MREKPTVDTSYFIQYRGPYARGYWRVWSRPEGWGIPLEEYEAEYEHVAKTHLTYEWRLMRRIVVGAVQEDVLKERLD